MADATTDDADRRAEAVLNELDTIARAVCHYDYGLPLCNDEAKPKMVALVAAAMREAVDAAVKSAPAWSSQPPTEPGYYWMRLVSARHCVAVVVVGNDRTVDRTGFHVEVFGRNREWCGPIEAPA